MQIGLAKDWSIEKFQRSFNPEAKTDITFVFTKRKENKIRVGKPYTRG
jgi:hypothetical protein